MRARTSDKPSKWNSTSKRLEFVESKAKLNHAFLKETLLQCRGSNFRKFPLEGFLKVLGLPEKFPRQRGDRTIRLTYDDIVPMMKNLLAPYAEVRASWHYGNRSYKVKPKLTFGQIQDIQVSEEDAKAYAKHMKKVFAPKFVEIQQLHMDGDPRATQFLNSLPKAVKAFEEHGLAPKGIDPLEYLVATASFPENQGRYYAAWHTIPKEQREKIWPNFVDIQSATPVLFMQICEELTGHVCKWNDFYKSGGDLYSISDKGTAHPEGTRSDRKRAFVKGLNEADESHPIISDECVQAALQAVSEHPGFKEYASKNQTTFRKQNAWRANISFDQEDQSTTDYSAIDRMFKVQYIIQVLVNKRETEIINELQDTLHYSVGLHDGIEFSSILPGTDLLDVSEILDKHSLRGQMRTRDWNSVG